MRSYFALNIIYSSSVNTARFLIIDHNPLLSITTQPQFLTTDRNSQGLHKYIILPQTIRYVISPKFY